MLKGVGVQTKKFTGLELKNKTADSGEVMAVVS